LCCQTEVEDLDPAVGRVEEVLGLDVAMRDPLVVRGCESWWMRLTAHRREGHHSVHHGLHRERPRNG
jgi:hypothetical protein